MASNIARSTVSTLQTNAAALSSVSRLTIARLFR
jgi:hypothetical protein